MDACVDKHSILISTADLWKAVSWHACFTKINLLCLSIIRTTESYNFCRYNLLSERQYGSRPYHSCETLLLSLTNKWVESMGNGDLIGLLIIDFRKTFDVINHEILIKKLACYGAEGKVL